MSPYSPNQEPPAQTLSLHSSHQPHSNLSSRCSVCTDHQNQPEQLPSWTTLLLTPEVAIQRQKAPGAEDSGAGSTAAGQPCCCFPPEVITGTVQEFGEQVSDQHRWSVKCRPPGLQAAGTSAHWGVPVSLAGAAWSPLPGTGSRSLVPNFSGSLWLQRTPSERARSFFAW